ncbi:MAG: hypothetical protein IT370_09025 [Deltaproteobacteria bacterium]|nr:hypothetical protein [Deltaproteobacteria bacterium]
MTILDHLEAVPPARWISRRALEQGTALVAAGQLTRPKISANHAATEVYAPQAGRVRAEPASGARAGPRAAPAATAGRFIC